MHVIVTGGLGFIGSNFIRHLLSENDIFITNIDAQTYAGGLDNLEDIANHKNYQYFKGKIQDSEFIDHILSTYKPNALINFAAETHVDRSIKEAEPFIETNIIGTHVLLKSGVKNKLKNFIQISTDEVYGSIEYPHTFNEESSIKPNSPYSASKASADHLVRAYNKTFGLNTIIIRCSNNFGPYQFPEKVIPYFVSLATNDKKVPVYGDGLNVRDWIYVIDFVRAIKLILEKGKAGEIYNVGGECELTNLQLVKTLLKKLGKKESLIEFVKDRPGHDRRYAMDCTKIKKELGWNKKYNFEEALDETIKWYRDHMEWVKKRTGQSLVKQ
ncbi:MAG: dTDP-glucose 4,6-dehydratase [Candidatus Melainabacteria bacterium]|nr:dTDP-glucose 4,6-dehydratase [Candidatus Melainabacteria bacterium]MBI3308226.1 dTDP-glucose 4,6-dehydratase [Candidatus Melainabacteria bacterium]